ncbi:MAG: sialate O-acetylesterase [Crocinitomicaceae bacterium]|nr:sialate O-acetylesterase [Crocinitomicaceae bacterium]MBK9591757.1 sialate O-acetylesterase [Crocinitomicaceae bacterium]
MKTLFLLSFVLFVFVSCRKDFADESVIGYDIILVAGQSNTHYGWGYDSILDKTDDRIFQLGRFNENDFKIIPAAEPLEHHTKKNNRIGFALTFAKLYANAFLEEDRVVLIIPCGRAGSGFKNNRWNRGDYYYQDAVDRTQFVLSNFRNSELIAVLWQQGEDDVSNLNYQQDLDRFIGDVRADLGAVDVPFILGGMVPFWVEKSSVRVQTQSIIQDTKYRLPNTAYADPSAPMIISKQDDSTDILHFDAPGMRELGLRYFASYVELRK